MQGRKKPYPRHRQEAQLRWWQAPRSTLPRCLRLPQRLKLCCLSLERRCHLHVTEKNVSAAMCAVLLTELLSSLLAGPARCPHCTLNAPLGTEATHSLAEPVCRRSAGSRGVAVLVAALAVLLALPRGAVLLSASSQRNSDSNRSGT